VRVIEDAAAYLDKPPPAETAAPLVAGLTKVEHADAQLLHRTLNGTTPRSRARRADRTAGGTDHRKKPA
jgi:hypothetical protein